MDLIRNRRSTRALFLGVTAGLLGGGPARLIAQDTTSTVPNTHTVKKGDTLWDLAAKYLSDAFRWPEIYRLNTDIVQDPHWIYPGEILKLPGYVGVALPSAGAATTNPTVEPGNPTTPPITPPDTTGLSRRTEPSLFSPQTSRPTTEPLGGAPAPVDTSPLPVIAPRPVVPFGDYISAPWVERREGPPVWGRIIGSAEIPGIAPAQQRARFQLNDRVLIAPPTGSVGPEHDLYLAYRYGPLLEGIGQMIVPTGVLEVLRPPRDGDAAVAKVVRMFREVEERDRLLPYDSAGMAAIGVPTPIKDGVVGAINWIADDPVLPPLEHYIVLTLTSRDGMKIGDQLELFKPRQKPADEGLPGTPEIHIGTAQVVRVTARGTTAIITDLEQPKVDKTTRVRVIAKMQ